MKVIDTSREIQVRLVREDGILNYWYNVEWRYKPNNRLQGFFSRWHNPCYYYGGSYYSGQLNPDDYFIWLHLEPNETGRLEEFKTLYPMPTYSDFYGFFKLDQRDREYKQQLTKHREYLKTLETKRVIQ